MLDDLEKAGKWYTSFRKWLYNKMKKAEKEDRILTEYEETMKTLKKISSMPERLENMERKIDDLSIGLQKELLTSLRTLRDEYCDKRGYCSDLEKEEYAKIYEVYHEKLGGNHTATRYLTEVLTLPTEPLED